MVCYYTLFLHYCLNLNYQKPTTMTATEKKERTGKPIEVLPRGTIKQQQLPLEGDQVNKFELKQGENGAFSYSTLTTQRHSLIPGELVKPKEVLTPKKRRAVKGTSDYLDFDAAARVANEILWHGRQPQVGFYVIFSINTGLRVGDVLKLTHADLAGKQVGDYLAVKEQKTGKVRQIQLNSSIITAYTYLTKRSRRNPTGYIFKSQKNHVFATVTINRTLKRIFAGYAPVVSSHSLRKTFGRRVYEMNGRSEHSLVLLSDIFGHSNLSLTRRYLGLRKEEISNVYLNL